MAGSAEVATTHRFSSGACTSHASHCVFMYACALCTYVCACMRACACMCVCVSVCVRVRAQKSHLAAISCLSGGPADS